MKISDRGLNLIKKYEGYYAKPYICPGNVATIGYGTTYYPNKKKVTMNDKPLTEKQADNILREILVRYENDLIKLIKKPINQNQYDALVSFTYNIGATNLSRSTLLKKININPKDPTIRNEFGKWVNAGGKKLNGLIKRRKDEADLYFS